MSTYREKITRELSDLTTIKCGDNKMFRGQSKQSTKQNVSTCNNRIRTSSSFAYHLICHPFGVEMDNGNFSNITVDSFSRGYHINKDETTWVTHIGEQRTLTLS